MAGPSNSEIIGDLHIPARCVRCYSLYKEIDNLGQFHCNYHPGRIDRQNGNTYTCCNQVVTAYDLRERETRDALVGCKQCDHLSTNDKQHEPPIEVSKTKALTLFTARVLAAPGIVFDVHSNNYIINRIKC